MTELEQSHLTHLIVSPTQNLLCSNLSSKIEQCSSVSLNELRNEEITFSQLHTHMGNNLKVHFASVLSLTQLLVFQIL